MGNNTTCVSYKFSAPVQTGPGAYPASCTMGTGSFPGVKRPGRGADHPSPSKRRGPERVQLYLYSPSGPSWPVIGRTFSWSTYKETKHSCVLYISDSFFACFTPFKKIWTLTSNIQEAFIIPFHPVCCNKYWLISIDSEEPFLINLYKPTCRSWHVAYNHWFLFGTREDSISDRE